MKMGNQMDTEENRHSSEEMLEDRSEAKLPVTPCLSETPMHNWSNSNRRLSPMNQMQSCLSRETIESESKSAISNEKESGTHQSIKRRCPLVKKLRKATKNKRQNGFKNKRQARRVQKKNKKQRLGAKRAANKRKQPARSPSPSPTIIRSPSEASRYYMDEWVFDHGSAYRRLQKRKNLSTSYVPSCFLFDSGKMIKKQTRRNRDTPGDNSPAYNSRRQRAVLGELRATRMTNFNNSPHPIYYSSESDMSDA